MGFPRAAESGEGDCMATDAVDPDLAGIDVVVAFLVTNLAMIALIITAWFHSSLPGQIGQQRMDRYLKRCICRLFLRREYDTTPASPEVAAAFESLLVSMNDQLLIGGLAILVAAYIKSKDLTEFSFSFASSLSGLSFMVSLTALMVLKSSMRQRTGLNFLRCTAVTIQGGLLLASRFHYSTFDFHSNFVLNEPWRKMFCGEHRSPSPEYFISFAVFMLFYFVPVFGARGTLKNGPRWKDRISFVKQFNAALPEGLDEADTLKQKAKYERYSQSLIFGLVEFQFARSFFWEIVWLILGFGCGFKHVISLWRDCSQPPGDEQQNCWKATLAMGFGQITAIVQLLVLLATFLDSYGCVKKAQKCHSLALSNENLEAGIEMVEDSSEMSDIPDFELLLRGGDSSHARLIKEGIRSRFWRKFLSTGIMAAFMMMMTDMMMTSHYIFGFVGVLLSYCGAIPMQITRYL